MNILYWASYFLPSIFFYVLFPGRVLYTSRTDYYQLWSTAQAPRPTVFYHIHPGFSPRPAINHAQPALCSALTKSKSHQRQHTIKTTRTILITVAEKEKSYSIK